MATCKQAGGSKRKRKVFIIKEKLEICRRLKNGATITQLVKEFGIGKSKVCDIKRHSDKPFSFAATMYSTEGSSK